MLTRISLDADPPFLDIFGVNSADGKLSIPASCKTGFRAVRLLEASSVYKLLVSLRVISVTGEHVTMPMTRPSLTHTLLQLDDHPRSVRPHRIHLHSLLCKVSHGATGWRDPSKESAGGYFRP